VRRRCVDLQGERTAEGLLCNEEPQHSEADAAMVGAHVHLVPRLEHLLRYFACRKAEGSGQEHSALFEGPKIRQVSCCGVCEVPVADVDAGEHRRNSATREAW
jgi:hypothetical protein